MGQGIDWQESFWSVPHERWRGLFVRVWLDDIPESKVRHVQLEEGECIRVGDLVGSSPQSDFAFRSLMFYQDEDGERLAGLAPFLVDIDIDRLDEAAALLQRGRVEGHCVATRRPYRTFSSGTGFHVEVDQRTMGGELLLDSLAYERELRALQRALDGSGIGKHAVIDPRHEW